MNPLLKSIKYLPAIYQSLETRPINETNRERAKIKVKCINAKINTQQFHRSISKIINFNE